MKELIVAACVFGVQYLWFLRILKPVMLGFMRNIIAALDALDWATWP